MDDLIFWSGELPKATPREDAELEVEVDPEDAFDDLEDRLLELDAAVEEWDGKGKGKEKETYKRKYPSAYVQLVEGASRS